MHCNTLCSTWRGTMFTFENGYVMVIHQSFCVALLQVEHTYCYQCSQIWGFYVELGYFYTVAIAILMKEKNIEKYDWASFILILNSNCFADLATLIIITDYWLVQIPYQILPMYLWFAKRFQLLRFELCFLRKPLQRTSEEANPQTVYRINNILP